jgi:hypothetical protein
MGIVNVSKTLSQSAGPVITGLLAGHGHFWITFVVAGSMKAAYDIGLLIFFVNTKLNRNEAEEHQGDPIAPSGAVRESIDDAFDSDDRN